MWNLFSMLDAMSQNRWKITGYITPDIMENLHLLTLIRWTAPRSILSDTVEFLERARYVLDLPTKSGHQTTLGLHLTVRCLK